MVVVDRQLTIVNETHERGPPAEAVIDSARNRRAVPARMSSGSAAIHTASIRIT